MALEMGLRIAVYLALAGCFTILPLAVAIILKKASFQNSKLAWCVSILIQAALTTAVFFHPVITYAPGIPYDSIQLHSAWARSILEEPFSGFYSTTMPLLAYRFHVVHLEANAVVAEVHYVPFGKMKVRWDGFYEITEELFKFSFFQRKEN